MTNPAKPTAAPQAYVVLDVETTGIFPETDMITYLQAVKISNGKVIDRYCALVNPGMEISMETERLTGITNEMVADKPNIAEVLPAFLAFWGTATGVAFRVAFDVAFLRKCAQTLGLDIPNNALDIHDLAKEMLPGLTSYTSRAVAKELRVKRVHRGQVLGGADIVAKVFCKLHEMKKKATYAGGRRNESIQRSHGDGSAGMHEAARIVRGSRRTL